MKNKKLLFFLEQGVDIVRKLLYNLKRKQLVSFLRWETNENI